jgi:tyrosine-protein phosphatase SIW14
VQLNGRLIRTHIAALGVALSLAIPATARTTTSERPSVTVDLSSIRIDNFGRINPQYYRGAQPKGRDYADLAALGVKTLINLTSDDATADEERMAQRAGLSHLQIPMTTHTSPTPEKLAAFLKVVNDPASQPVYVHCVGGRHRTGVMTAIYRMTQDGWTSAQAFQEMKHYKFGADFLHPEFKAFVYGYRPELADAAPAQAAIPAMNGGS